jgi:hypothetical protein
MSKSTCFKFLFFNLNVDLFIVALLFFILSSFYRLESTRVKREVVFSSNGINLQSDKNYLLGEWKGTLRNKNLVLVIESIKGNNVIGYNIVGNNKRSLKGKIFEHDSGGECKGDGMSFRLVLSEPGDDKWDGVFKLVLQSCPNHDANGEIIEGGSIFYSGVGVWKSNNGKLSGDISLSK